MSRAVPCSVQRLSALPLLYADEKFDGVLFDKNSSEKSVLGQMIEPAEDPKTPKVNGSDGAGVARGRGGRRGSPRGVRVFIG